MRVADEMARIEHILLPTDFSVSADHAAAFASDLARRYDAAIDVVHAWAPPHDLYAMMDWLAVGDEHERNDAVMAGFVDARCGPLMRQLLESLSNQGVRRVRGLIEPGLPSQVILDLAESDRYDLIVMASHGRTGLADVLIGSCVERVVRRSHIPVLVVPISREQLRAEPWRDDEHEPEWLGSPVS